MKQLKFKPIWVVAGISFAIAAVEGFFYYADVHFSLMKVLLILYNAIKAFLLSPSISLKDVWEQLEDGLSPAATAVSYAYSVAVFSAFLCTATAVFTAARHMLQRTTQIAVGRNAEHIFVFGYHEDVKALLRNCAARSRERGRHAGRGHSVVVHVVAENGIPEEARSAYLRAGIFCHEADILSLSGERRRGFLQRAGLPQGGKVILMEDSAARNFSLFLAIRSCWEGELQFCLSGKTEGVQWLIGEAGNRAEGRESGVNDIKLFSIPELRVRKMFHDRPLHDYNLRLLSDPGEEPDWDVHLLIVGFGEVGREVLRQAILLGPASGDGQILIDVVDRAAMEKKSMLESTFHESCLRPGLPEGELEIGPPAADGRLRIRFHQMDIRGSGFRGTLEKIELDGPITYGALCTEDADLTMYCMTQVQRFLMSRERTMPPLAVRLERHEQIAAFLQGDKGAFANVYLLGVNSDILTLEHILDPAVEEESAAFNSLYCQISDRLSGDAPIPTLAQLRAIHPKTAEEAAADWRALSFLKRESNRCLCYHNRTKALLLRCFVWQREGTGPFLAEDEERWSLADAARLLLAEEMGGGAQDAFFEELAKVEHRRWSYFMALQGWGPSDSGKDEARRLTPYLICWRQLKERCPEMCVYDVVPSLTLLAQGEDSISAVSLPEGKGQRI